MSKRTRASADSSPSTSPSVSPTSSPRSARQRDPSLSRPGSFEGEPPGLGLGDLLGPVGAFSVGTTRPAGIAPTRRRRDPRRNCPHPNLDSNDAGGIPVLQVYLNVTGNLQPGAAATKESLKGQLVPFATQMVDQTLKRPNIFFMPTVKLTNRGLKSDGSEPMQVLDSATYYSKFLERSAPERPCDPTRPKLFDNVKDNIDYVKGLYFPIGGKIMLPQVLPGKQGVQGYEVYRIDAVEFQPLELPASALPSDTRQTLISDLQLELKRSEDAYEQASQGLEAMDEGHADEVSRLDADMAQANVAMEGLDARMKANNQAVDKLRQTLLSQQATNETRMGDLQAAIDGLQNKYPDRLSDALEESRYQRERNSAQMRYDALVTMQKNYDYYIDIAGTINWGAGDFDNRERSTQTMQEYAAAKTTQAQLVAEREQNANEGRVAKATVRDLRRQEKAHMDEQSGAEKRLKDARENVFKKQEELNAAKGGWLIDRVPQGGQKWWITTESGYAFPRLYNVLFDIRVSYVGDEGEGVEAFWGLDCTGKAQSLDRRISELVGRNPNTPFTVFKEFIQAYEPPWSPFASPAAFTSEGRRTAQTQESQAQLQQARQVERNEARERSIRTSLAQRIGAASGNDRGSMTLDELRAYGLGSQGQQRAATAPGTTAQPAPMPPVVRQGASMQPAPTVLGQPGHLAPNTQGPGLAATAGIPIQPPTQFGAPPPSQPPMQFGAPPPSQPPMQFGAPSVQPAQSAVQASPGFFPSATPRQPVESSFFENPHRPSAVPTPRAQSVMDRVVTDPRPGRGIARERLDLGGGQKTRRRMTRRRITRRRKARRRKAPRSDRNHSRRHSRRKPSTR